jgi:hypothetical protein
MSHPSFFALDQHALLPNSDIAAHLASCESCRAHVASVQQTLPIPGWLSQKPRRAPWLRWLAVAPVLALLAIFVVPSSTQPKGAPGVTVWVRSGQDVSRWDGAKSLHPGDAVRLELSGLGYPHGTVVGRDGKVLFHAPEPGKATMTPAWELDTEPGDETLTVIYSHEPLAAGEFPGLLGRRDTKVWTIQLVLKKETPPK